MKSKVEMYSGTYKNFAEDVYSRIRKDTYGDDFGQIGWLTSEEYRRFIKILDLSAESKVLEIASGSGGPAVYLVKQTGCYLTGVDINENGVANAQKLASANKLEDKINFMHADASGPMPFAENTFDAVISFDSINHLKDRENVFKECFRVLKPGCRLLYTDPVIVTGILSNTEIAERSSIGYFLFVPPGGNERLLEQAGFVSIRSEDVTENMASVSLRWHNSRERNKSALLKIEDDNNYSGQQRFLNMVHKLAFEKRLSRILFTALKKQ